MVVVTDSPHMPNTKSRIVTGELRVWGDVRENGKDKFVWEFENCENGLINVQSKELRRVLALRLVWGAGAGTGCDGGTVTGWNPASNSSASSKTAKIGYLTFNPKD